MKASIIFTTIALLATQVLAAPTQASAHAETRRFQAQLIFIGSDPSQFYTLSVPTTSGSTFEVNFWANVITLVAYGLSVSKISDGGASCELFGAHGSDRSVVGASTADVGPPQPQVSGACSAL